MHSKQWNKRTKPYSASHCSGVRLPTWPVVSGWCFMAVRRILLLLWTALGVEGGGVQLDEDELKRMTE